MFPKLLWPDALPELVEHDAVEEGESFDDLVIAHVEQPDIRVVVGLTVPSRAARIEEDDDRVALGVDTADCRLQPDAYAGVEGPDHLAQERILAGIALRCRRVTDG